MGSFDGRFRLENRRNSWLKDLQTGYIRVKKSLSDESVIIFWEISSYHWDKVFKTLEISGAHEISGAREVSEFHNDYQLKW